MLRTGISCAWATSECASSCASTEAKNSSAATSARPQLRPAPQVGCTCANPVARFHMISQQISSIQAATGESVAAIEAIGQTIGQMSEIASTIASTVAEQGAANRDISENVRLAADGTQQVSSNISDVQRGAVETGSASAQVLSSARSLAAESNRLKDEVRAFLETVRAA